METSATIRFATTARRLTMAARRLGLRAPSFASPPRLAGLDRSLRRRTDGSVVVAVRVRSRPWPAVLADLVEGVIRVNGLSGAEADRVRAALWEEIDVTQEAAPGGGGALPSLPSPPVRLRPVRVA